VTLARVFCSIQLVALIGCGGSPSREGAIASGATDSGEANSGATESGEATGAADSGDDQPSNAAGDATDAAIARSIDADDGAEGDGEQDGDGGTVRALECRSSGEPIPLVTRCPLSLCGNGKVDMCPSLENPRIQASELCDGEEMGGRTCQTSGFFGGTLRCTSKCGIDTALCDRCTSIGGSLAACRTVSQGVLSPRDVGLAANASELALAWISVGEDDDHWSAHVARLGMDGVLLGSAEVLGRCLSVATPEGGPVLYDSPRIAVSALGPTGWLVAVTSRTGIDFELFDGALSSQGSFHLPGGNSFSPASGGFGTTIAFAPRPNGGPLLAWIELEGQRMFARATILSADGRSASAPVVAIDYLNDKYVTAAFVDDGFLVASVATEGPWPTGGDSIGISVARIELDGSIKAPPERPVGGFSGYPTLAPHGATPRLIYESFTNPYPMMWTVLDSAGRAATDPVQFASSAGLQWPMVSRGDDVIVATQVPVLGGKRIEVLRLNGAGASLDPPIPVATDPGYLPEMRMVALGSSGVGVVALSALWPSQLIFGRVVAP
jgi:hypothetical protein